MSVRPTWAVEFSPTTDPFDPSPVWEEITSRVRGVKTTRGRQQELDVMQPGDATVVVDNGSRTFDPNNAAGDYYGDLLPGKRVRVRATYGAEGLDLPGAAGDYASSPDAGWVPGQEVDFRALLALDDWTPAGFGLIFAQTNASFSDASVAWGVTTDGRLSFSWFTAAGVPTTVTSDVLGFDNGSTHLVRVTLDTNNGAGLYEVKFYESTDDGASWAQIGSTATGAATAVPRNSTSAFTIGSSPAGFPMAGTVYRAELGVSAIGTVDAVVRFTDGQRFAGGASSGTDTAGNTWTLQGAASLPARARTIFGGFAEGWPVAARSLGDAPVGLVDGFGLLAGAELPDGSPLEATIRSLRPVNYWKLGDPVGSSEVADAGTDPTPGIPNGGASDALGGVGLDAGSEATSLVVDGYNTDAIVDVSSLAGSDWLTLVMLFSADPVGARAGVILDTPDRTLYVGGSGGGGSEGKLYAFEPTSPTAVAGTNTDARVDDGTPHLLVVRRTSSGTFTFEIDGAAVAASPRSMARYGSIKSQIAWTAGESSYEGKLYAFEGGFKGTIQHLALFDRVLTAGESAALADADEVWIGDTIDARVGRLLDLAGWSTSERDLDASEAGVLGAGAVGTSALDDVRTLERSEAGSFYQRADYVMRFRSRYATVTDPRSTAVRYTFTDEAGAGRFRFEDLVLAPQGLWIRNRVTVSWVGGSITVEDPASGEAYGWREHSIDTVLTTAAQARSLAELVLGRFAEPVVRVSSLDLNPGAEPNLWEPILDLELGDRVRVVWTPGDVGDPVEVEGLVEGISISAGDGLRATATLFLSGAYDLALWRWGVSTWGETTRWG